MLPLWAAASCSRGGSGSAPAVQSLVGQAYSEQRLLYQRIAGQELRLDFRSGVALEGVRVGGAELRMGPAGLLLTPEINDARMAFDDPDMRYNLVRVEMSSPRSGELRVFWATRGAPFTREHSKAVAVHGGPSFQAYEVDLSEELDPVRQGYRLRIDPIDNATAVTIKEIVFRSDDLRLPGSVGVRSSKVKIGREVRQALTLAAGSEMARQVRGGDEARLVFGLARVRGGQTPLSMRVLVRGDTGDRSVFEETLEPSADSAWLDRRVDLVGCPTRGCEVILEVAAETASEHPSGVFVSTPVVIGSGERRRPNVILISLDTLGARHLSTFGGPAGTTPGLDRLASQGVAFEHAFANSSVTHTSHAALLTGSPPLASEYYWLDSQVDGEVTLPDVLRRSGYLTAAFTAGILVSEGLRFDRGFETFYQHDTLYRPPEEHSDIAAIAARATSWVESHRGAPLFLFFHTYEAHSPYVLRGPATEATGGGLQIGPGRYLLPPHMRGKLPVDPSELPKVVHTRADGRDLSFEEAGLPLDPETLLAAYRDEIRFLDRAIVEFLAALEAQGVLEDAIVVVTSDHGEAFLEHGLLEHGLLYDENLRVPLVLWAPGRLPEGERVESHVSSIDVAPTILELAGVEVPAQMAGRSLMPVVHGTDPADREFYTLTLGNGLTLYADGGHKLVVPAALGQDNFGRDQLFDIRRDPGEKRDLLLAGREIPSRLQRRLRRAIEEFPGIHVDLSALAGRRFELELPFGPGFRDNVYAFDLERIGLAADQAEALRCTVALSETSRLVVRSRVKGRRLVLSLRPADGGEPLSFVLDPPETPREKLAVASDGGDGTALEIWRVSKPVETQGGFSAEETERLRSLGYVQ